MDAAAKRELAHAILSTYGIRENSYIKGTFRYALTWEEAADKAKVDPDLKPLVVAMLTAGFVDFLEWAERQIGQKAAA